eukprot:TRINITY_DN273_c0_g1_i3.p1 TRINITY_DN273_c0_g1~~TRINITY_DN273_c0_g1_i3.p1  ORF type:complete len:200 (+),score=71.60 TRINITY_DN273_c0_g1_i3:226-825(+)
MDKAEVQRIKIVLVGDVDVGKSSMLVRIVTDEFPETKPGTIFDNSSYRFEISEKEYDITFFETAGQEDFDRLRPLSYPQTDIFFLMYSVDNPSSYETIQKKYASEVKDNCPNVPIIVIATKTDLREDEETINLLSEKTLAPVSEEDGRNLSEKIGAGGYLECSALKNKGMNDFLRDVFEISSQKSSNNDNPKGSKCIIS